MRVREKAYCAEAFYTLLISSTMHSTVRIKKAIEVMIEGVSKSLPNEKSMIDILHYL